MASNLLTVFTYGALSLNVLLSSNLEHVRKIEDGEKRHLTLELCLGAVLKPQVTAGFCRWLLNVGTCLW